MAKVQRRRLEDDYTADRISMLPDEILGLVLSSLTLKEATATSILCSRWRYLWIVTPKLDLDLDWTATLDKLMNNSEDGKDDEPELHKLRCKYVRWVDRLLAALPKPSTNLVQFRVLFDLSSLYAPWIDDWLSYAVGRKVRSLDLNLIEAFPGNRSCSPEACYTFPYKNGNFPDNLKLLKKLSMHLVNVSGEAVAFLLGNCRVLEQLSVSGSRTLLSLEVVRTSPLFKCLEISRCSNLKSVVVRGSEVVCFKYSGVSIRRRHFVLVDVPLLTQLWIQAPYDDNIGDFLELFDSVLPQLHTLKIYFLFSLYYEDTIDIISHEMPNLKELVVLLGSDYSDECSLVPVINLISVAPCLQRFVVEASHRKTSKADKVLWPDGMDLRKCCNQYLEDGSDDVVWEINRKKKIQRAYSHIKEVEFVGYRGVLNHFQMVTQLVKHCPALENILVDPRSFKLRRHMPWDRIPRDEIEDEIFARDRAKKQLKKYVPSGINVNII